MYKTIPLFLVKENMWTQRVFLTREEYVDYLWSLWKVPGKYEFDSTSFLFNKEAREFQKNSAYCFHAIGSKDFVEYWDTQKERNRNGVIFRNGDKEWFLNRDYYFLLNYLKVYNKEKKNFTFIDVRDAQYHMALYEEIAEHSFKHVAVLKKRQILSSYFHMAKLVNRFWFEAGSINKLAASLGNYIKDDWRFAEEYRDFLNTHTAWYRPCTPDKLLDWQQKIEINQGGKKRDIGLKSVMKGLILDKDPSAGTGGPCHRLGTKILMSSGKYKNVEDIQIGEYVLGVDNIPKQVLRKFSGEATINEILQSNGITYYCTNDHMLYLKTYNNEIINIKVCDFLELPIHLQKLLQGVRLEDNAYVYSNIEINKLSVEPYAGIEVEDNLYYLEDLTITHNCSLFFHDEAGIAPKMNQTIEFLLPALKSGMIYTGMFMAAGSVGDLDDCGPLEDLIKRPHGKDILAVKTDLYDNKGTIAECGLFIPEQWSMPPYVDEYGNSKVEEALEAILAERKQWEKDLTPEDYQLRISQKPISIEEAFATRKESPYPTHLITKQIEKILNNDYYLEYVDVERNINGEIDILTSRKIPISDFPVNPKMENKEGVIVMHERPTKSPKFGTYYASLDPVNAGKTVESNSLACIYIYKNQVELTIVKADGTTETRIEPDKLVCWWTGRFDDLEKTHERIEMLLELYNAWCVVENNVTAFNTYMIKRNKQKYLVPKNQMVFLKEIGANTNVYQDYGWRNTGRLFKDTIMPYGIQFLKEELDHEVKSDGTIVKTYYGIDRIPDIMLLKEMLAWREGLNVDRIIAFSALAAFVKVQNANRGLTKEKKYDDNLQKQNKNVNLKTSPFTNMGGSKYKKTGFKNIR
jgi:hypothetical protein